MIFNRPKNAKKAKKAPQPTLFQDDLLDQVDKQAGRKYQRELMRKKRSAARDVKIDTRRRSMIRRNSCQNNPERFCQIYFPGLFYRPFTKDQRAIIKAIQNKIQYGGYQAIAAERGGGKSTISKVVGGIWGIVYGYIDWIMLINANGPEAETTLKDLKDFYQYNDILNDDFPEVCNPIRALEDIGQRARFQTVNGKQSRMIWGKNEIVMPRVTGSKCSGAIITAIGIEGNIRGKVKAEKRPDLIILDDIENHESAKSYTQTNSRREIIGKDILGLAGPGRTISALMLCTVINRKCIAWEFTDIKQQPAWSGIRQKWIKQWPTHADDWQDYLDMRRANQIAGDPYAREAHAYYIKNRKRMDAGVVVSNPLRYDGGPAGKDGPPKEISSIQAAYNQIGDRGLEYFSCEFQNEPPEELNLNDSDLNELTIKNRATSLPMGIVPEWAEYLTAGIDVGGRQLHWTITAWKTGMIGHVISYGTTGVPSPVTGRLTSEANKEALEAAINTALMTFADSTADGFPVQNSEQKKTIDLALVDSGWQDLPVFDFCRITNKRYRPCKGFGTSHKLAYRNAKSDGKDRILGFNWSAYWQPKHAVILYHVNSDFWKLSTQNSFIIDPGNPGSLTLFGEPRNHTKFANHILAEKWTREFIAGKGIKETFDRVRVENHWLDATQYAAAAASVLGLRTVNDIEKPKKISLARLQEERRNRR